MATEPVRDIIYAYSSAEWVGYDDIDSLNAKVFHSLNRYYHRGTRLFPFTHKNVSNSLILLQVMAQKPVENVRQFRLP